ncbi:YhgE/Pip domain-containing protein [Clostridium sp.]|jgi:putative membrane protein|uniref:YhgE/Pip domain-containing protein n=1 Tax=Clostridium sp. TaxID=1506 RepID=UPI002FDDF144
MIRNIIKIFKKDMKSIIKNPMALFIITGVCIIPSLYAWINIKAVWDPYAEIRTQNIPIAVVNKDNGTSFRGENINAGNNIVDNLKNNHKIGWKFVNSKKASIGILNGTYYAMIEIPEDFSSRLVSITSDNPKKPEIIYKVDTKNSPLISKITNSAKDTLLDSVKSNFIYSVNKTIFSFLNILGENADKNKNDIIKLKDNIIKLNDNMELITYVLGNIKNNSSNLTPILNEIKTSFPLMNSGINILSSNNEGNRDFINSIQPSLNNTFDNIAINLENAKSDIYRTEDLLENLNSLISEANSSSINSTADKIGYEIDILINEIDPIVDFLEKMSNFKSTDKISNLLRSLNNIQKSLKNEKNSIKELKKELTNTNEVNEDILNSMLHNITNLKAQLIDAESDYNNNTRSALNSIAKEITDYTDNTSSILKSIQDFNKQGDNAMDTLIQGSQLVTEQSGKLNNKLFQFKDNINKLSNELKLVTNNDIIQIITILQNNPELMGDFISSPFDVKEENIYTVSNFGSSMAPMYTALAMWVGSIMLVTLLRVDVCPFQGSENLTLKEKYLGKLLTFTALAAIQGIIVILGDKFLLHVQMVNVFLMIMVAFVSSVTFAVIVYTLVSILGNFGRAISIILLIIQIAGSGATYPIQLQTLIFRILQPLFPFTYSVSGFREAVAGPLISTVVLDFSALILISVSFILIGLFLKEPLHNKIHKFQVKFKDSGIGE